MSDTFTPGPWAWFANARQKNVYLATPDRGRQFVMQFERAGMQGAQPVFQVNESGRPHCGRMVPLFYLHGVSTEPDHNGEITVTHPDALLMAAAPEMHAALAELTRQAEHMDRLGDFPDERPAIRAARALLDRLPIPTDHA